MVPLTGNTEAVVNAKVVTPEVDFCATLSPAASVRDAPVTCPPMAGDALGALVTSALVCTATPAATDSLGAPVVSCPAANVTFCNPAGITSLVTTHMILIIEIFEVHGVIAVVPVDDSKVAFTRVTSRKKNRGKRTVILDANLSGVKVIKSK